MGKRGRKGAVRIKFLATIDDWPPVRVWWDAKDGAVWFRRKNSRNPLRLSLRDAWRAINEGGLVVSLPISPVSLEPHPELFTLPASGPSGSAQAAAGDKAASKPDKGGPQEPGSVADR